MQSNSIIILGFIITNYIFCVKLSQILHLHRVEIRPPRLLCVGITSENFRLLFPTSLFIETALYLNYEVYSQFTFKSWV